jgi:ribose-phosphate pyrophosphokinase
MILCFDDEVDFARGLGLASGLPVQRIARHRFPDGELKLTLPPRLSAEVRILRSLHAPNEKLVELILAARAARELGAREVTLIAPYLAYMRQDSAFRPGEVVSQKVIGRLLADLFDAVVTVDPHLHRIATLNEAVPLARATPSRRSGCTWRRPTTACRGPYAARPATAIPRSTSSCRRRRSGVATSC